MKILVTGATGFIGGAIAHRLVEQGHRVRCLVRPTSDLMRLSDMEWEKVEGDITSAGDCEEATQGMDVVIHSAANVSDYGPWKLFEQTNMGGTRNMAQAALKSRVGRFLHISSILVLGAIKDRPIDDSFPYCKSGFAYADTKIDAEAYLFEQHQEQGLPLVVLRPSWVYGPGDTLLIPGVAQLIAKGKMIYFGHKTNFIYLNYIDNLLDAVMLALERDEALGRAYLVTDDQQTTWEYLCNSLAQGLDLQPPSMQIPTWLAYGVAAVMEGAKYLVRAKRRPPLTRMQVTLMGGIRYDISRIRKELGYEPAIGHEEGIARSIQWMLTQPIGEVFKK